MKPAGSYARFAPRVRHAWISLAAISAILLASLVAPIYTSAASASSATGFNPGNIISDDLFYDGNAMNAGEVQAFLDGRVQRCTIGDQGRSAGSPYGNSVIASKCLRNYTMNTVSKEANSYCGAYLGLANESAAAIIAKVGKACGISQRVLLITLEKEQSLVSDTWPTIRQIDVATGYGCPDNGPNWSANCDPKYYGFQNQVYYAAWQLRHYKALPNAFDYKPFQTNTIPWNPNPGCGTSQVYIENSATAALYIYTPYRPNQAALNAGWGTGDSCSSYGNRNFYLLYTSWFGPTTIVPHATLDSATGEYGGILLSGWARRLSGSDTAYVWVNVYDLSGSLVTNHVAAANQNLSWFDSYFPGWGNSHGFKTKVPLPPGNYRLEVFNSSEDGRLFATRQVSVPFGIGSVDSVEQSASGVRLRGWSVDFRTTNPDSLRVTVDGKDVSGSFTAGLPTSWINNMFPGAGNDHGFDINVPSSLGTHTYCVYGAGGLLSPCTQLTLVDTQQGSLDTVSQATGGARVTGWARSLANTNSQQVAITVDGTTHPFVAERPLSWFDSYFPTYGPNHGFDLVIPVERSGLYEFCLVNQSSGEKLSCKAQSILSGETTAFDSATATVGSTRITGWSAIIGEPTPSYVWVNVDGVGGPHRANSPLSWFDAFAPGSGPNHGFDLTLPMSPGHHEICVYGAATGTLAGCKTVIVPVGEEQGSLDNVTGGTGSIRAWGWSQIQGQTAPTFIWVSVDGVGGPYRADLPLSWFNSYFPGQGNNHGFDVTVPATKGNHQVCVSGAKVPTLFGCKIVTVL